MKYDDIDVVFRSDGCREDAEIPNEVFTEIGESYEDDKSIQGDAESHR